MGEWKGVEEKGMENKRMGNKRLGKKSIVVKNMNEKQRKTVNMLTLAFGMAFMPPIWAVPDPS